MEAGLNKSHVGSSCGKLSGKPVTIRAGRRSIGVEMEERLLVLVDCRWSDKHGRLSILCGSIWNRQSIGKGTFLEGGICRMEKGFRRNTLQSLSGNVASITNTVIAAWHVNHHNGRFRKGVSRRINMIGRCASRADSWWEAGRRRIHPGFLVGTCHGQLEEKLVELTKSLWFREKML